MGAPTKIKTYPLGGDRGDLIISLRTSLVGNDWVAFSQGHFFCSPVLFIYSLYPLNFIGLVWGPGILA